MGQLGFAKTHGELREWSKSRVKHDHKNKCWLRKSRRKERQQFIYSDEARDDRVGVGGFRTVKHLHVS